MLKRGYLKFMYISIYKGVGEGSFSISYHHNVPRVPSRPIDGQQRCVAIRSKSITERCRTLRCQKHSFNPILQNLLLPQVHFHTFHHLYRQWRYLGVFARFPAEI